MQPLLLKWCVAVVMVMSGYGDGGDVVVVVMCDEGSDVGGIVWR